MRSCLHTYRTKTNLTQHIIQPWGGGPSVKYGGVINQLWGGAISQVWGGVINQLWGDHQPSMGGVINQLWGGAISQVWGGGIFPPVCTGSQNPENYFSNTYVLPSVNRTAGPKREAASKVLFATPQGKCCLCHLWWHLSLWKLLLFLLN